MIWRLIVGTAAVIIGAVWIGQGLGGIHGSFMTGHSQYTALGVVLVIVGLAVVGWAASIGRSRRQRVRGPG